MSISKMFLSIHHENTQLNQKIDAFRADPANRGRKSTAEIKGVVWEFVENILAIREQYKTLIDHPIQRRVGFNEPLARLDTALLRTGERVDALRGLHIHRNGVRVPVLFSKMSPSVKAQPGRVI